MINKNSKSKDIPHNSNDLLNLSSQGLLDISPVTAKYDLSDTSKFVKVEMNNAEKSHISALLSQTPMAAVAGAMPNMYTVKFPKGINGTLMQYKTGGVGSAIMGDSGISGHAAFYQMTTQAALLGIFTAMSIATSQYFLTQIHNELNMINLKIDKILGFLYGDKKAELLSEISYAKRAYNNFSSIIKYDHQRIATLTGLQQSGKIAIKDIEFYIQDLDSVCSADIKSAAQLERSANDAMQIRESLNLSLQLYITCCILEIIYSQNNNESFIKSLEDDLVTYIDKCNNRMNTSFGALHKSIASYKIKKPLETKFDKAPIEAKISSIIDSLHNGEASDSRKAVEKALNSSMQPTEFIIDSGEIYYVIS